MRSLAPLLVISTLTVLGSGVALRVLGPGRQTFVLGLHKTSFIFWLGVTSVHVLVYVRRLPRLLLSGGRQAGARIGLLAGSLLEGAALAAAT
jgi:hypothetical protein